MTLTALLLAACGPSLESQSQRPGPTTSAVAVEDEERGWIQIELDIPDAQHVSGLRVRGGTLDGRTTLDTHHRFPPLGDGGALLRATPFHSEIRRGQVVYGFFDGQVSNLMLVTLASGVTTVMANTKDVIHSAAVGDDGSVYFLSLDAATRDERGVFRAQPGQPPVLLLQPRAVTPVPVDRSSIYLSPGGQFLLVHDCGFETCVLRVYGAETGEYLREYSTFARGLLGVFAEAVVAGHECDQAPCRAVGLALDRDEARPFGKLCDRSRAFDFGGQLAVVTIEKPDCLGDARDLTVNPMNGGSLPIGRQEFAGMDVVGIAAEPSANSIVVATDGQLLTGATGYVVDVDTGDARPFVLD